MSRHEEVETPEVLQGLGLSEDQFLQVRRYIGARVVLAKEQRMVVLAILMVLAGSLLSASLRKDVGDLPFRSLVDVALEWLPVVTVAVGVLALLMKQLRINLLNAQLGRLGLSERALERVRSLAGTVILVAMLGRFADRIMGRAA
ncbi:MAG: hypothetical protein GAK28_04376 [Luteibacter sp.]|uniref:hypothetical protein n=1 Tax=Luteibacter sp. TaxID=1886636 RepID=UPI001383C009|nr:hypothetical protein [Luteibacter sp.]KAF1003913.1 MAG: hypothetical protein GAK28_04376 [Luteibacter sp.]